MVFLFISLFLHISIVKVSSVHVKRKSFIHLNTLMQCPMLLVKNYYGLTFVFQNPSKFILESPITLTELVLREETSGKWLSPKGSDIINGISGLTRRCS